MKKKEIIGSYYGGISFLKEHLEKKLTIFIIDDNEFYAELLREKLARENNFIHIFSTGEEALNYVELEPDLIIIDYHLDGKLPYAKKGDVIAKEFKALLPEAELMLITSDQKLTLFDDMGKEIPELQEKDAVTERRIDFTSRMLQEEKELNHKKKKYISPILVAAVVVFLIALIW